MIEIDPSAQCTAGSMEDASHGSYQAREASDQTTNDAMRVTHRGVVLTVTAQRSPEGSWLAAISASIDGQPLDLPHVQPATPEWLTESEALRAGIEHGCYLVDRYAPNR